MVADENPKVRHQLKVAGKRLMNVLGQPGEDGTDGPIALLGISDLLPSVLQGQPQYSQIIISSFQPDTDGAVGIEPLRHASNQCLPIGPAIFPVRGLPDVGVPVPARLYGGNDSLDGVIDENDFLVRKAEEFTSQVVDLVESRPLILSKVERSFRRLDHPIDQGNQCILGRLGPFALRHVVR